MAPQKILNKRGLRERLPQPLDPGEFGICLDTDEVFVGGNQKNIKLANNEEMTALADTLTGLVDDLGASVDRRLIDLTKYGITGDGVSDDTQGFINALNNLDGRVLFIPAGNYKITDTLIIPAHITIIGAGPLLTRFYYYGEDATKPVFKLNGDFISLSSFSVWMGGSNSLAQSFIDITNGKGLRFDNLYLQGVDTRGPDYGLYAYGQEDNNVYYNLFSRISISRCKINGVYMRGTGVTQNTFIEVTANHNGGDGWHCSANQITLISCYAEKNMGRGFYNFYGEASLYSCYFEGNANYDYESQYGEGDVVIGCRFLVTSDKARVISLRSGSGGYIAGNQLIVSGATVDYGIYFLRPGASAWGNHFREISGTFNNEWGVYDKAVHTSIFNGTAIESGSGTPSGDTFPNGTHLKRNDGVYFKIDNEWYKIA
ncbi:MAG: hypothetical protein GX160_03155 [Clostridiales bacterium]|nr:hypothetical protein [Clostridiales bacterium]